MAALSFLHSIPLIFQLVAALALLMSLYWLEGRPALNAGAHLLVATLMVVPTLVLYQGRTDFTR